MTQKVRKQPKHESEDLEEFFEDLSEDLPAFLKNKKEKVLYW